MFRLLATASAVRKTKTPNLQLVFSLTAAIALGMTGCGGETRDAVEINTQIAQSTVTPAVKKSTTSTVTPSKTEVATSPAKTDAAPSIDADPSEVCQRFMELLQAGNRIAAENLLTRAALAATSKAGLKLEPMGSPTSRYEMGTTRYATIKNELAQVECEVIENIDGTESRAPVTWLVRKQNTGWRISGLLVQLNPNEPQNLLSFENVADVEEIKARATTAVLAELEPEAEARQAQAKGDDKKLK